MEYHAAVFEDFSYLIFDKKDLIAVFVAGRKHSDENSAVLIAHPGLTYGGLVYVNNLKYNLIESIYDLLIHNFIKQGFSEVIIKPVPSVFCSRYSEANLFYFSDKGFVLHSRELNSVVDLSYELTFSKGRKDNIRKAQRNNVVISESNEFKDFWDLLTDNLWNSHKVIPVHSLNEIILLKSRFPDNIKLYIANIEGEIIAGVVVFSDSNNGFVHTQYISANDIGKKNGAVDAILNFILIEIKGKYSRFSFGISTSKGILNSGLLNQKEGFGSVIEVIDSYKKTLRNYE